MLLVLMHMARADLARGLLGDNIRARMDGASEEAVNA